ncbi:MAG: hypothetical protein ACRC32_26745 [Chroococcidiopsis sp.]
MRGEVKDKGEKSESQKSEAIHAPRRGAQLQYAGHLCFRSLHHSLLTYRQSSTNNQQPTTTNFPHSSLLAPHSSLLFRHFRTKFIERAAFQLR